jgi:hypothetical protein
MMNMHLDDNSLEDILSESNSSFECEEDDEDDDKNDEEEGCTRFIERKVTIDALVSISPHVSLEEPDVDCCNPVRIEPARHRHPKMDENCNFVVRQELCLRIPLIFEAEVKAKPLGIECSSNSNPSPSSTSSNLSHRSDSSQPCSPCGSNSSRLYINNHPEVKKAKKNKPLPRRK